MAVTSPRTGAMPRMMLSDGTAAPHSIDVRASILGALAVRSARGAAQGPAPARVVRLERETPTTRALRQWGAGNEAADGADSVGDDGRGDFGGRAHEAVGDSCGPRGTLRIERWSWSTADCAAAETPVESGALRAPIGGLTKRRFRECRCKASTDDDGEDDDAAASSFGFGFRGNGTERNVREKEMPPRGRHAGEDGEREAKRKRHETPPAVRESPPCVDCPAPDAVRGLHESAGPMGRGEERFAQQLSPRRRVNMNVHVAAQHGAERRLDETRLDRSSGSGRVVDHQRSPHAPFPQRDANHLTTPHSVNALVASAVASHSAFMLCALRRQMQLSCRRKGHLCHPPQEEQQPQRPRHASDVSRQRLHGGCPLGRAGPTAVPAWIAAKADARYALSEARMLRHVAEVATAAASAAACEAARRTWEAAQPELLDTHPYSQ